MDERVASFLAQHHGAVMTTLKPDGTPAPTASISAAPLSTTIHRAYGQY